MTENTVPGFGYTGPAAHTYTPGCAGDHPPAGPCPAAAQPRPLPHLVVDIPGLTGEIGRLRRELADLRAELYETRSDRDRLAAEAEQFRVGGDRLMRLIEMYVRSLYAVWIDVQRGDLRAVKSSLADGLDGFDGPEWDGTETGTKWLERTSAEGGAE